MNAFSPIRCIQNICLYILYVLWVSVIFSFIFPVFLNMMWKDIPNATDPLFVKIQVAICILVLIITVIFRKNFYRALSTKMKTNIVETKEKVGYTKTEKKSDSKMKIYIDKEIK